jgi:hypothetical protein
MTKEHIKIYRNKVCVRFALPEGVVYIRMFDNYHDAQQFIERLNKEDEERLFIGIYNFQGVKGKLADGLIKSFLKISEDLGDILPTTRLN